jgi:alpha-D-xyloside xylohydrolase
MFKQDGCALVRRFDKELLRIEAWGDNGLRVRATQGGAILANDEYALLPASGARAEIKIAKERASIRNGALRCEVFPSGKLRFYSGERLLLEEYDRNRFRADDEGFNSALEVDPRAFEPRLGTDNYKLTVTFESDPKEKLFGMGQYQQPYLELKGCVLELAQRNSQASVPFLLSSKGYGFLWNNPAVGKVAFGKNVTEWTADSTKQMDYWIVAGDTPAEIEKAYSGVAGRVPMMPDYAMGFWQCKLRYQTQDEILEIARGYAKRKVPVSVIVADYFHWPHQGDWRFDEEYWPDPEAMVKELKGLGMELMVSVWPTVDEGSENYKEMVEKGYLARSEHSTRMSQLGRACFVDVTNPEARDYLWAKVKKNYYDKGIKVFWLDEAEPEYTEYEFRNYRYSMGSDLEVGNIYPLEYARCAYEGMDAEGQKDIINLIRCAWAGSQRYGALVWSGDIDSSFRSLRSQLVAGLNMGIAGIPWWTTDIGGFHGGNIKSPEFRECLVRWFEFGAFCPVFRLHGMREPMKAPIGQSGGGMMPSGAENEIWSYGEECYVIFKSFIELREKMRPYTAEVMTEAHESGYPAMRTLFFQFPGDDKAWEIDDEFLFGGDILVCPILYEGMREREVYFPKGKKWRDMFDGSVHEGGQTEKYAAPIDRIPAFTVVGSSADLLLGSAAGEGKNERPASGR